MRVLDYILGRLNRQITKLLLCNRTDMDISCSVGIMAYNEGGNLKTLLESLLNQRLRRVYINEIIIVASGCTDNTVEAAKTFLNKDYRIKILIQKEREGKASAINLFLNTCITDIVVILNADLLLKEDTIQHLVEPFFDSLVGMTGGRAISINDRNTFVGFASHLLWDMHHKISLKFPKLGELVAYRKINGLSFPSDTVDDEGIIEAIITKSNYILCYIPQAVFYNKGPLYISEFLKRRRNIFAGHLQLRKRTSYMVSTIDFKKLFKALFPELIKIAMRDVRSFFWTITVVLLEVFARILAVCDVYILQRDHSVWEKAESTKKLRYDKFTFRSPAI